MECELAMLCFGGGRNTTLVIKGYVYRYDRFTLVKNEAVNQTAQLTALRDKWVYSEPITRLFFCWGIE